MMSNDNNTSSRNDDDINNNTSSINNNNNNNNNNNIQNGHDSADAGHDDDDDDDDERRDSKSKKIIIDNNSYAACCSNTNNNNNNTTNNNNITINNNNININEQPIIRRRIIPSNNNKKTGLIQYAKDYTSQNGEDGIIEKIFDMIHNQQNQQQSPSTTTESESESSSFSTQCCQQQQQQKYYYCVDVGAWDGKHLSNSYSLLVPSSSKSSSMTSDDGDGDGDGDGDDGDDDDGQQHNHNHDKQPSSSSSSPTATTAVRSSSKWRGLLIEADQQRYQQLCKLHEPLGNICINSTVTCTINDVDVDVNNDSNSDSNNKSSTTTLPSILKFHLPNLPKDFDFISIDVDGPDYWILYDLLSFQDKDNNYYYKPKVICIEANPTMPNDLIYIPPRSNKIRHGASLAAIVELAESYGYVLVAKTIYNAFFILRNLYERNKNFTELVPDTSIEAITRNEKLTMGTSLYQLYDGTIKLWGCKKLLWHRQTINEEQIQVLKPSEREFPFSPPSTTTTKEQPVRSSKDYNIINLSPYCDGDGDDQKEKKKKQDCSEALINQLKLDGFALVNGFSSSQAHAAAAKQQQEQQQNNNSNNNILLSNELCQNALKVSNMFLHDADESVRRSSMSIKDRARRGYSPINTENFASLLGNHGPNDLVRKFRIGPTASTTKTKRTSEQSESATAQKEEGQPQQQQQKGNNSPLLQPNIWPNPNIWDPESCHMFQSTVEEYYDGICKVANIIVKAICDGLIAKQPHLRDTLGQSMNNIQTTTTTTTTMDCNSSGSRSSTGGHHDTSILTLLGYSKGTRHHNNKTQQQKTKKKKKRVIHPLVAAHTDVGIITVLLFDDGDCAVLQRQVKNEDDGDDGDDNNSKKKKTETSSEWADVTLPNDTSSSSGGGPTFVVNIADCLSELSGNYLPSTIHRVMPSNDGLSTPRNCLALFVGLDPKQTLYFNNNTNNNTTTTTTTNTGSMDSSSTSSDDEGGGGDGSDEKQRNTKTMTYEEWRKQRIIKSQTVLKQQKQQQQHTGKKL